MTGNGDSPDASTIDGLVQGLSLDRRDRWRNDYIVGRFAVLWQDKYAREQRIPIWRARILAQEHLADPFRVWAKVDLRKIAGRCYGGAPEDRKVKQLECTVIQPLNVNRRCPHFGWQFRRLDPLRLHWFFVLLVEELLAVITE